MILRKFAQLRLVVIIILLYSLPQIVFSQNSVLYDFNTASQLSNLFNGVGPGLSSVTQESTGGLSNSGSIAVPLSSSVDAVYTSKDGYSLGPVGSSYVFESFIKSEGNGGYSGVGFTTTSPTTASTVTAYRPNVVLGISVHGGGFIFHNNGTNYSGSWGQSTSGGITAVTSSACNDLINSTSTTCGSPDRWYKLLFKITRATATTFNMRVEIWPADANATIRYSAATAIFEVNGVTNTTISSATQIFSYFNFSGTRVTRFDNYKVNLGGGSSVVQAGFPVVFTPSYTSSNNAVTVNGDVTSANGSTVTERGIVYGTTSSPTISNNKIVSGNGTGTFSAVTPTLSPGIYYFRAYATNSSGTSYGAELTTTICSPNLPTLQFKLSAPDVTTSAIQGQAGVRTENFNTQSVGALAASGTVANGTYTKTGVGAVAIEADAVWGGTSSQYLSLATNGVLNITLTDPSRYLGFWWGGGDANNRVTIFGSCGGNEIQIGQFTTSVVENLLAGATVTAVDGNTYPSANYRRVNAFNQPFAYINLELSDPNVYFTRMEVTQLAGGYFEIDNITTGTGYGAATFTTPAAPTITSITAGGGSVSVAFTAPTSNGGQAITNYEYSINGGTSWVAASPAVTISPLVISGLTIGTTYPIRIRAVNSIGAGAQSNSVNGAPIAVAPVITSFTPTTAGTGESVVVTGTGFAGVTVVKFGNVNASSFVVNSATQITAVVGAGASGDVLVQNSAGSDTEAGFIYKVVELKFEGNALDQTGAGRNGTIVGTATYSAGASGQAICFSNNNIVRGTSVQNYLTLPSDLIRGRGSNFTISLRFKTSTYGAILGYQNAAVGAISKSEWVPILYVQSDGKLNANLWQGSVLNVTSTSRVDDGNWHKVEFSAAPGSITVYIDGVLAGTSSGTIDHLAMSFNQLGAVTTEGVWTGDPIDGWFGFNGCIDEFIIVDKSLTASQIQQVTQLPLPTITSFSPTTAKSGETITITGTNLGGASSVRIGGVNARSFTAVSATEVRAIVGKDATLSTNIELTTAAGSITATTFTFDCTSNALDLDGTNDHVVIGDQIENFTTLTQEAWVYWKGSSHPDFYNEIFTKDLVSSLAITNINQLHVNFGNGSSWGAGINSTTSIPLNTWTHIAVTRSATGSVKIYINGVLDASTATLNLSGVNAAIRAIGVKPVGTSLFGYFNGAIDELKVWNTERTAAQVLVGMGSELVGDGSGLLAYYNFNQGTAGGTNTGITTLNNLTPILNLNGTLTNLARSGTTSNFVKGVWPVIITQPTATTTACSGVNVSLTVSAVGPQLSYQWYTNNSASNTGGTAITGATSATYTYTTTTLGSNYFYAVVTGACSQTVTSTVSTVDVNATNWTKIYETTNPSRNASGEMVYTAGFGKTGGAASSHNGNFSRIKYRLENNVAGTLRWAEVTFDRLDNITLADLQIPDLVNNILIQKNVSNIEVTSNMPGVHTGKFSTGRLEFWNMDYRTFRSDLIPAGDASTYDWDDRVAGNSNGHGSFQIHNVSPQKEQTIFAWNMHLNGGTPEIGIGNAPSGNPDWTFNTSNGIGNFKVQISVQEAPVISPNGVVSACVGTPVTLTASAGASYLWSNGATTQSISTANAGSYTVTVTQANGCNSSSLPKTVTVNPLPSITYPNSSNSFERTKAIAEIQPTVTGVAVSSYAISPALPTGLSFNTTTGGISGTPEVNSTARIYTVTASTAFGCASATTFTLEIFSAVPPSALSYAPASQTVRQATTITSMTPTAFGGVIDSYTISPALPAGLTFNTATGEISGTLNVPQTGTVVYTITATNSGGSSTATVTLIYNTAPANLTLSSNSVAENAASGTAVGTLSATDKDDGDTFTYTLVSGTGDTDNASFAIDGGTLKTVTVFDYETKTIYFVRVRVTDAGGLSFEKAIAINITNVNEAPTNIFVTASSVLENAALGTSVATMIATDVDAGDTFTYSLVSGTGSTDNASFTIVGNSIRTAAVFDFETKNSYSVRVRVTDAGGLNFERAFTIAVINVNEAPTLTAITDRRVYNVATSQVVDLAGITAGPETYQTTTTSVSTSNPSVFSNINIVGTQIQFTLAAGIATPQDVVVTVRVRDNGGVANGGVDSVVRTFRLGIDPMPVATASPNLITLGAIAQLNATGANAVNYTWVAVGGTGIVGSGATINVRPRGTTTYAVVVTNSFGYQATVPVLLTVIADYKLVPNNLVTPNGDGVNDKWVIPNIDMYPDNEVMLYDKAGRVVFAKRGYNNEWDGTLNGTKLKEDAYFYVIKFNKDGALPIRGYVSIVR